MSTPDEEWGALVVATARHIQGVLDTLRTLDLTDTPPAAAYTPVATRAEGDARAAA
ncbi:hypothetical protein GCM10009801_63370 [Streptomyces albiaxialis]|uniref:MarR family transcriptional regulator n=1 Tax=Streptomyces albiaxialis TaxID=329523 RepID=A0ABP5I809_9ACTN